MQNKIKKTLIFIFSAIFFVCLWHLFALFVNSSLILPTPQNVLKKNLSLLCTKHFYFAIFTCFCRCLCALFFSSILALLLGFLMGLKPFFNTFFKFPLAFIKATPVTILVLLSIFWFSSTKIPIFVAFLMILPILTQAATSGIEQCDEKLKQMCKVFNFSPLKKCVFLYFPSVWKNFSPCLINSFELSWKIVLAGEILSLPKNSVGEAVYSAKVHLESEEMFAWTLGVVIFSQISKFLIFKIANWGKKIIEKLKSRKNILQNTKIEKLKIAQVEKYENAQNIFSPRCPQNMPRPPSLKIEKNENAQNIFSVFENIKKQNIAARPKSVQSAKSKIEKIVACTQNIPQIKIENLCLNFENRSIFNNFNICFEEKKVTAILASSGAGKTTLLNCIAGILPYKRGKIIFKNQKNAKISYIFQDFRFLPWLSVEKNCQIAFDAGKNFFLPKQKAENFNNLCKFLNISFQKNLKPCKLSGGEMQRFAFLRALMRFSPIFLLDEAFNAQDFVTKQKLYAIFENYQKTFCPTTILVTHSASEALKLADRIIVLKSDYKKNGELKIVLDKPAQNTSEEEISRALG